MKKVSIKRMVLRNFKGVKSLEAELGPLTVVKGDNGAGKTTLYDAYLWCLFGITSGTNQVVQPLDSSNNVIHKLETSVLLEIEVDEVGATVERRMVEKWRAAGTPEEKFEGTTTQRYYNEVPCSVADFNAKLNSICNIDTWILLSNVRQFMSLKMDDRRKLLLSLTGNIDEEKLLSGFPAVKTALSEGKSLEELSRQMKSIRKRSDADLLAIPTKISAQDKLKVVKDWSVIREEISIVDNALGDIDKEMQASPEEMQESKLYKDKVNAIYKQIEELRGKLQTEKNSKLEQLFLEVKKVKDEKITLISKFNNEKLNYKNMLAEMSNESAKFEKAKESWKKANDMEFSFDEKSMVCPVCHRPFTEEMKAREKANAVAEFNRHKSELCSKYIVEAQEAKKRMDDLSAKIQAYEQEIAPEYEKRIEMLASDEESKSKMYDSFFSTQIDSDERLVALNEALKEVQATKPQQRDVSQLVARKREFMDKRDALQKELSLEETNNRIDKYKIELEEEAKTLAQTIADCDDTLYQIKGYKRQRVEAMEDSVNSFFELCQWKFYEKNISNDDDKEVCTCIHNGVEFESQNNAMRVNMGIDIINGLSKSYGVEVPLFVDNAESVNKPLSSNGQCILLKVSENKQLSIELPF